MITTPFEFSSTADDVLSNAALPASEQLLRAPRPASGSRRHARLAAAGAEVTLAVRNVDAGRRVATQLTAANGSSNVSVAHIDLSDQQSVKAFAVGWHGPLHMLINNGGIMALPELTRTKEGWEMQLATNFIGHFALSLGLHGALAAAGVARIVSVSSSGNLIAPLIFDDLHFDFLPYDPLVAYGQCKTACALLAVEATRRWAANGIYANALNPGAIATNLQQYTRGLKTPPERRKSTAQGTAPPCCSPRLPCSNISAVCI